MQNAAPMIRGSLQVRALLRYSAGEGFCPSPRSRVLGALSCAVGVFVPSREDVGVPRSFAAARLGVNPHTVSMWVQRGWVDAAGVKHKVRTVGWFRGGRLYRWGDLVEAEWATRNNRRSTRHRDRAPVGAAA